ncbi:nucleic acid/nucleotide deaminase domain-containing protein, partial [Streptomyces sp. H27-H5]|uniref:nucleic acid/nucleotide deaminase domain-containing protein n=1 Tax=Streptomyces sp. H27-H5 TaxID=2996460 RepID=UPI00226E5D9D
WKTLENPPPAAASRKPTLPKTGNPPRKQSHRVTRDHAVDRGSILRSAAAQEEPPCVGVIAYYSTELARQAYHARKAVGFTPGRNVAVARVPGWNDSRTGDLVVGFSKGEGIHSEDHILAQLKAKGFTPSQITELYSERSPCDVCKPKLAAALEPGTPISWSVPNGPGSADLLRQMIAALERTSTFRSSAEQ